MRTIFFTVVALLAVGQSCAKKTECAKASENGESGVVTTISLDDDSGVFYWTYDIWAGKPECTTGSTGIPSVHLCTAGQIYDMDNRSCTGKGDESNYFGSEKVPILIADEDSGDTDSRQDVCRENLAESVALPFNGQLLLSGLTEDEDTLTKIIAGLIEKTPGNGFSHPGRYWQSMSNSQADNEVAYTFELNENSEVVAVNIETNAYENHFYICR